MNQLPVFMKALQRSDPEFFEAVNTVWQKSTVGKGALDSKTRTLILLALDALGGHARGVSSLAKGASSLGASKQEINEALRLAYLVAGNGVLVAGMAAFEE